MNLPQVTLHVATNQGRLYLFPDPEVAEDLLDLRAVPKRAGAFGFNISGIVLFAIDRDRLPVHVEIVVPRRAWIQTSLGARPTADQVADIRFTDETIEKKYVEAPTTVFTDADYSCAQVLFGDTTEGQTWVSLSEKCLALVSGDSLMGFFVDFK
ncbi:MAG: hypothetical protein IT317_03350 [Anaerolineales bacterium]|nr:hypothetical protein [Anaerolineales bacterium]